MTRVQRGPEPGVLHRTDRAPGSLLSLSGSRSGVPVQRQEERSAQRARPRVLRRPTRPARPAGVLVALGLAVLVPVLVLITGGHVLPLVSLAAAALLGYRAFAVLSTRHATLARLYELSDVLAAAQSSGDIVQSLLRQSLDLMDAGYAEIMITSSGPVPLMWSLRAGDTVALGPQEPTDLHRALSFPPEEPQLVRLGRSSAEAAYLACRSVREALVVPLRIDGSAAGHLLVADSVGERRGFAAGGLRLLETVANHGGVALRNGRLIERLQFEARHDELTGLPNRFAFRDLLEQAGALAADGLPSAVMVLDFDGFKAVNDTLGHSAGDELLRVLAGRFAESAGSDAVVARLGGDEFAVVAHGCPDAAGALALAQRLLRGFEAPVALNGTRLRVGGSLGIALAPDHGTDASALLRNADIAMYAAKAGAGGARLFSDDLVENSTGALILAGDLRDAITDDEISIVLQPLVDLDGTTVHSLEVLARWNHPVLGPIAPEEFFAAAERSGQISTLSTRILDRALGACRSYMVAGRPVRVGVNLARRWLADPTLPEQIGAALARHGVPADLLCLELTESSVIAEPRRSVSTLARLRDMGVHLSVDDFGTGYSSLTYLSRLPVGQIKIDKAFVQRMCESTNDRAIVRSILDLGRNLGLEVVAEGVTDSVTREALREMGCRLAQGYLFTEPVAVDDVPALLDAFGIRAPV